MAHNYFYKLNSGWMDKALQMVLNYNTYNQPQPAQTVVRAGGVTGSQISHICLQGLLAISYSVCNLCQPPLWLFFLPPFGYSSAARLALVTHMY